MTERMSMSERMKLSEKVMPLILHAHELAEKKQEYEVWTACCIILEATLNLEIGYTEDDVYIQGDAWRYEEAKYE